MLKARYITNQSKAIFRCNHQLRLKHSSEGYNLKALQHTSRESFHQTPVQNYPATKQLPLPLNIEDLNSSERLKFSPQRSRDINGSFISSSSTSSYSMDLQSDKRIPVDDRIECYDCSGTINLNSAMQTNVPFPFVSRVKPIHLNMPGGQWRQKEKYVSEELNNVHHTNTRTINSRKGTSFSLSSRTGTKNFCFCFPSRDSNWFSLFSFSNLNSSQFRSYCSVEKKTETVKEHLSTKEGAQQLSVKEKLKVLVKEYGPVAIVVHISISATALLLVYLVVASGIDTSGVTKVFGASEGAVTAEAVTNYVVAYAIHKMLAPFRVGLTLAATPLVVKKLRKLGVLKSKQQ